MSAVLALTCLVAAVAATRGARRRQSAMRAVARVGADVAGGATRRRTTSRRDCSTLAPRPLARIAAPPTSLVPFLADAGLPGRVLDAVPTIWAALVVAVALVPTAALVLSGPLLAGLVAGGLFAAVRWGRGFLAARAAARVEADLPLALDEVVRSLRSGASLTQALAEASALPGPLGRDLRDTVFAAVHGDGLAAALEAWAAQRPLPGVRLTVAALTLGLDAGGAQARAIDGVATTLRERQQLGAEVRALASQARMSAVVLSVAPLGFAVVLAAIDDDVADFFLHRAVGTICLAVGIGLDAGAAAWMGRVAKVAP